MIFINAAYTSEYSIRHGVAMQTPVSRSIEMGMYGRVWECMGGGQIPPTAGSRSSPVSSIQRNARQKHLAAPAAHALYSPLATPECNGGGSMRLTNDKPAEKSVFLKKNSFVPLTSIIFCHIL